MTQRMTGVKPGLAAGRVCAYNCMVNRRILSQYGRNHWVYRSIRYPGSPCTGKQLSITDDSAARALADTGLLRDGVFWELDRRLYSAKGAEAPAPTVQEAGERLEADRRAAVRDLADLEARITGGRKPAAPGDASSGGLSGAGTNPLDLGEPMAGGGAGDRTVLLRDARRPLLAERLRFAGGGRPARLLVRRLDWIEHGTDGRRIEALPGKAAYAAVGPSGREEGTVRACVLGPDALQIVHEDGSHRSVPYGDVRACATSDAELEAGTGFAASLTPSGGLEVRLLPAARERFPLLLSRLPDHDHQDGGAAAGVAPDARVFLRLRALRRGRPRTGTVWLGAADPYSDPPARFAGAGLPVFEPPVTDKGKPPPRPLPPPPPEGSKPPPAAPPEGSEPPPPEMAAFAPHGAASAIAALALASAPPVTAPANRESVAAALSQARFRSAMLGFEPRVRADWLMPRFVRSAPARAPPPSSPSPRTPLLAAEDKRP